MGFKAHLEQSAARLNPEIDRLLGEWSDRAGRLTEGRLTPALEQLPAAAAGGKRLRGALVLLGYDLAGAPASDAIVAPAAAYEILHTALLIQDDAIDQSPTRHGRPTAYQALGHDQYGSSMAVCLGDAGLFLAMEAVAATRFEAPRLLAALTLLARVVADTAAGQMLDLTLSGSGGGHDAAAVPLLHQLKTATYSVAGPLQLGAGLGGAPEALLAALGRFGGLTGAAFQIQDDILGVFGEQDVTGKSATSDIATGKPTLLITHALAHAELAGQRTLRTHYGHGPVTPAQHTAVRHIFETSGALESSRRQAKKHLTEAKRLIPALTADPAARALLAEFADFTLERPK